MAGRICIVVGHGKSESGGYDSGAVGFGYEKLQSTRKQNCKAHTARNAI